MDGCEAVVRIRRLAGSTATRPWVVGTTASDGAAQRDQCLAAGMNALLPKPLRLDDVCSVLCAQPWLQC